MSHTPLNLLSPSCRWLLLLRLPCRAGLSCLVPDTRPSCCMVGGMPHGILPVCSSVRAGLLLHSACACPHGGITGCLPTICALPCRTVGLAIVLCMIGTVFITQPSILGFEENERSTLGVGVALLQVQPMESSLSAGLAP